MRKKQKNTKKMRKPLHSKTRSTARSAVLSALLSAVLVVAVPLLGVGQAYAADAVNVSINGNPVRYDQGSGEPFVDQASRTQVPFRQTMESFGCSVSWEEDSQTAVAVKDGVEVRVPIGASYIYKNGAQVANDTAALIKDGRTYLPIRAVLESFGAQVSWEESTGTVLVYTDQATGRTISVHFIDAGQGDSILIDDGEFEILIDGSTRAAAPAVVDYLKQYVQGDLEVMIATHEHEDHIGGLPSVLDAFTVDRVIDNGRAATTKIYQKYVEKVTAETAAGCVHQNASEVTGPIVLPSGAKLELLKLSGTYGDPNNNSLVGVLQYGSEKMLFTGDMESSRETENLSQFPQANILKAGHHGSRTSSGAEFLSAVRPETVIVSAGENNTYGHPHSEAMQRFLNAGAKVYGTFRSGSIVLTTDGTSYQLNTDRQLTMEDVGAKTPAQ